MGWTSYIVEPNKSGTIDRKKEIDSLLTQEGGMLNGKYYPKYEVLKSSMVGSTYYAAVKETNKDEVQNKVFAAIYLTSVQNTSFGKEFGYKGFDENSCPYQFKCPPSILKLLTPATSELGKEWRQGCYKYQARKKDPHSIQNLPVGTIIEFETKAKTSAYDEGVKIRIKKYPGYTARSKSKWIDLEKGYKWSVSLIEYISKGEYSITTKEEAEKKDKEALYKSLTQSLFNAIFLNWIKNKDLTIHFTKHIPINPSFSSVEDWKLASKDDYYKDVDATIKLDMDELEECLLAKFLNDFDYKEHLDDEGRFSEPLKIQEEYMLCFDRWFDGFSNEKIKQNS
jgi:hypothetical protein